MLKTDLKKIIESKSPQFFDRLPDFLSATILRTLERIVHAEELYDFFEHHGDKRNQDFIGAVFDYLNFSYDIPEKDWQKIPAQGRLICVANHSNGPLDGLILLHLLGQVRQDVKIVVSDLLAELDNLNDLFLLYDQYSTRLQKKNIAAIRKALLAEQAVIFFPAGQVTKLSWQGIREQNWHTGAFSLAYRYEVPILPIAIQTHNSAAYYLAALTYRHLSTLLLSHEMFRKRNVKTPVFIGDVIRLQDVSSDLDAQAQHVRHDVACLGKQ